MVTPSVNHSGLTAILAINFDFPTPCPPVRTVQVSNFTPAFNIRATAPVNVTTATDCVYKLSVAPKKSVNTLFIR